MLEMDNKLPRKQPSAKPAWKLPGTSPSSSSGPQSLRQLEVQIRTASSPSSQQRPAWNESPSRPSTPSSPPSLRQVEPQKKPASPPSSQQKPASPPSSQHKPAWNRSPSRPSSPSSQQKPSWNRSPSRPSSPSSQQKPSWNRSPSRPSSPSSTQPRPKPPSPSSQGQGKGQGLGGAALTENQRGIAGSRYIDIVQMPYSEQDRERDRMYPPGGNIPGSAPPFGVFTTSSQGSSNLNPNPNSIIVPPIADNEQFLNERRAQAAGFLQTTQPEERRSGQVQSAVARAKERIRSLGLEKNLQRHEGKGCQWDVRRKLELIKYHTFWGLWGEDLKEIEGTFGSAVVLTFSFLRWVFILNIVLALLWIGAVIIPFFLKPPSSFGWPSYKQYLKSYGLEKTWILLGGYYYQSEQTGLYRTDYVYPCAIIAMFLISLFAILGTMSRRIMGSGEASLVTNNGLAPYATLVFTAWDFRITSLEAASKLRKGIRMQLREMLADSVQLDKEVKGGAKLKLFKRYTILVTLWPLVMAGTIAGVYFLVSYADMINAKFNTTYAQAAIMSILVSMIGPFLVRLLVRLEGWKPATAERVLIMKLFFLRAVNLSTFLYRLYIMLQSGYAAVHSSSADACLSATKCPRDGFLCCNSVTDGTWGTCLTRSVGQCASKCMENEVGKQILKLIMTSTVIGCVLDLGSGLLFGVILHKEYTISIPDFAIDVIYLQVLIWVGSHFSPVTTPIGVVSYLIIFYSKKLTLKTCTTMQKLYSASRTSVLTYGVLFMALILSVVPEAAFVAHRTSGICGPIRADLSMYDVVANYIGRAGNPLHMILEWIASPVILIGVIILLAFVIVLLRAKIVRLNRYVELRSKEQEFDVENEI